MLKRLKQTLVAVLLSATIIATGCSSGESSNSLGLLLAASSTSSSSSVPTTLAEGEFWSESSGNATYTAAQNLANQLDSNNEKYILFYYETGKSSYSDRTAYTWVDNGTVCSDAMTTATSNGVTLGYIVLYDGTNVADGVPANVITALDAGENVNAIVKNLGSTWTWQTNDCQLLSSSGSKHFLITSGSASKSTNEVYTITDSAILVSATAESSNTILVNLSLYYGLDLETGDSGFVVKQGDTELTVSDSINADSNDKSKNAAKNVLLTLSDTLSVDKDYTVTHASFKPTAGVSVNTLVLVKDATAYTGDDLGLTLSGTTATFKTWAPVASSVSLLLYTDIGNVGTFDDDAVSSNTIGATTSSTLEGSPAATFDMVKGDNNVWSTTLDVSSYSYYKYKIVNAGTTYYVSDIWGKACTPDCIASEITDVQAVTYSNPFTGNYENAVIYEMHVTDWSKVSGSITTGTNVGKFTYLNHDNVINHLTDLGVTHVQLLPIFDFAETKANTNYNWGYNPYHYNVPEGRYVTSANDGSDAVDELRALIDAFHNAGIAVIMDVVYNHTSGTGEYSLYDSTVPGYFYRFDSSGNYSNGSGCGNEIDSEAPMAKKYIIDSLKHWMNDYGINGFRFDLMGCLSKETMADIYEALYEIDNKVMVYGEPWTGGTAAVTDGSTQAVSTSSGQGVGAFDDDFRDAIKGAEFGGFQRGQVQDANKDSAIVTGLLGNVGSNKRNQTSNLGLALHYIECHDNYTLYDKLAISRWQDYYGKETTETISGDLFSTTKIGDEGLAIIKKWDTLAAAYVLLSQGTVFMDGGQEFLRTKRGNENSYNKNDGATVSTNGIDITMASTYSDVYNVYKGLIALRKANTEAFGANSSATASTLSTGVTKYTTEDFVVFFNASDEAVTIDPTAYTYEIDVTSGTPTDNTPSTTSLAAKSFVIFKN